MSRPINFWNLEPGREYFIQRYNELYKYKVIFSSLHGPRHFHDFGSSESAWFIHRGFNIEFDREDTFYDAEEIRDNAQKARQQMEHRALNKVLKQIVNETFEW
jgi:DNA primase catalytic subunit